MVLYSLAVIIFSGLLFGKIIKIFKLPQVTGYLIAGVIIGPFCLKLITFDNINSLELFSTVALSFISFLIGTELKMKYLKKLFKLYLYYYRYYNYFRFIFIKM